MNDKNAIEKNKSNFLGDFAVRMFSLGIFVALWGICSGDTHSVWPLNWVKGNQIVFVIFGVFVPIVLASTTINNDKFYGFFKGSCCERCKRKSI